MNEEQITNIIEAALLAAGRPLSIERMLALFEPSEQPTRDEVRHSLEVLAAGCAERGVELVQVSSGYRYQVKADLAQWIGRLSEDRPPRYSRALLETLSLVAYRQPITRAEIEDVRGVSVSSSIVKTLMEREWIRIVGHRDVPGRPALYATTRYFLDYFSLKSLSDLPPLSELRDIESIEQDLFAGLEAEMNGGATDTAEGQGAEQDAESADEDWSSLQIEAADDGTDGDEAASGPVDMGEAADAAAEEEEEQKEPDTPVTDTAGA